MNTLVEGYFSVTSTEILLKAHDQLTLERNKVEPGGFDLIVGKTLTLPAVFPKANEPVDSIHNQNYKLIVIATLMTKTLNDARTALYNLAIKELESELTRRSVAVPKSTEETKQKLM